MDHRCGTRFTLSLAVELETTDQPCVAGRMVVASVTGALIETRLRPPPLSPVLLRPLVSEFPAFEIEAYVVRVTDRGLALEWLDPACEAVRALLPAQAAPPRPVPAAVTEESVRRSAA